MLAAVIGDKISFTYDYDLNKKRTLNDISLCIDKGEFIAIIGANGSGKSTLAKHFNAILPVQKGKLSVLNMDASDEDYMWELRRLCGMVFQNPDNQFVSSIVEEDVAFGLYNYDTPEEEIDAKVHHALTLVGMEDAGRRSPNTLSGGQKQRIAMAGVLVMAPEIIIFDEATAMLDPVGREEVLTYLKRLHSLGKTIIMITHYVEEAICADRVFVMKDGQILKSGAPDEILTDASLLRKAHLMPPVAVQIYYDLLESGIVLKKCPLTNDELVEEICRLK